MKLGRMSVAFANNADRVSQPLIKENKSNFQHLPYCRQAPSTCSRSRDSCSHRCVRTACMCGLAQTLRNHRFVGFGTSHSCSAQHAHRELGRGLVGSSKVSRSFTKSSARGKKPSLADIFPKQFCTSLKAPGYSRPRPLKPF